MGLNLERWRRPGVDDRSAIEDSPTFCRPGWKLSSSSRLGKDIASGRENADPNYWGAVVDAATHYACKKPLFQTSAPAAVLKKLAKVVYTETDPLQQEMLSEVARRLNLPEPLVKSGLIQASNGFLTLLMSYCSLHLIHEDSLETLQNQPSSYIMQLLAEVTNIYLTVLATKDCQQLAEQTPEPFLKLLQLYLGLVVTAIDLTNR